MAPRLSPKVALALCTKGQAMNEINHWFLKHRAKNNRFTSLYDMLFLGKVKEYLIFRLRLFNLLVIEHYIFHAIVFYLFFKNIPTQPFLYIVAATSTKSILLNFWWGMLEELRTRVRFTFRASEDEKIEAQIGYWLIWGSIIGLLCFIAGLAIIYFVYTNLWQQGHLEIHWFYIGIISILFSLQVPFRVYHSGIYALSRIMRPGLSMIIADFTGLIFLAITWSSLHLWSIPLAVFLRGLVSLAVSFYYTKNAYSLYHLTPKLPGKKSFFKESNTLPYGSILLAGCANAIVYLHDSLIIFGIAIEKWKLSHHVSSTRSLFLLLVLVAPMLNSSANWSFLFYFDRKRLLNPELVKFSAYFNRIINKFSAVISLFYWAIAFLTAFALLSPQASAESLILLPYFILIAKISNLQQQAFAEFRYLDVLVSGVLMAINLGGAYFLPIELPFKLIWSLVTFISIYHFLTTEKFANYQPKQPYKYPINFYAWLMHLHQINKEGAYAEVYRFQLTAFTKPHQIIYLIEYLNRHKLNSEDFLCRIDNTSFFILLKNARSEARFNPDDFIKVAAGVIQHFEASIIPPNSNTATKHFKFLKGWFTSIH